MPSGKRAWVAATLDTKFEEADYICGLLEAAGMPIGNDVFAGGFKAVAAKLG